MDTDALLALTPPWIHFVRSSESEARGSGWKVAGDERRRIAVRFLRGSKMHTLDALFDEFGAALQFPGYFGENWPAFDECLNDLSWLTAEAYVLMLTQAEELLSAEPTEIRVFVKLLQKAGAAWSRPEEGTEIWSRPARSFHVVLQSETHPVLLRRRLEDAGARFDEGRAR